MLFIFLQRGSNEVMYVKMWGRFQNFILVSFFDVREGKGGGEKGVFIFLLFFQVLSVYVYFQGLYCIFRVWQGLVFLVCCFIALFFIFCLFGVGFRGFGKEQQVYSRVNFLIDFMVFVICLRLVFQFFRKKERRRKKNL